VAVITRTLAGAKVECRGQRHRLLQEVDLVEDQVRPDQSPADQIGLPPAHRDRVAYVGTENLVDGRKADVGLEGRVSLVQAGLHAHLQSCPGQPLLNLVVRVERSGKSAQGQGIDEAVGPGLPQEARMDKGLESGQGLARSRRRHQHGVPAGEQDLGQAQLVGEAAAFPCESK